MSDKNNINPLDDLFTDEVSQIDVSALAAILKPYIRINRESKNVIFTPDGMKITATKKIILFTLARKALYIRGEIKTELLTPSDIKNGLDMPSGTIDPALKKLSDQGPLRNEDGKYFIPDFKFQAVQEIFSIRKEKG
jgi:DNA-binding MarR family transcriptional regulator